MEYDLPDVIRVEADGPVRIVTLSRPDHLNAINEELHLGLTRLFPQLSADRAARFGLNPRGSPGGMPLSFPFTPCLPPPVRPGSPPHPASRYFGGCS